MARHDHWCPTCGITTENESAMTTARASTSWPLQDDTNTPIVVNFDRFPTFGQAFSLFAAAALADWLFRPSRRR